MDFIKCENDGTVAIVTMEREKANPLNKQMLGELHGCLKELESDEGTAAVVIASHSPKVYSAGFDVEEVFNYDREAMGTFFGGFMDFYEYLVRYPKPTVAAVGGHAYAGGAIVALACDERIFAEGKYGFALNEINLGIVLPPGVIRMATVAMGEKAARSLVLDGHNIGPDEALACGLATQLVARDDVLSCAKASAAAQAKKPPLAYAGIKGLVTGLSGHDEANSDRAFLETFLDYWFGEECVGYRKALSDSLKK